ncbi:MAG: CRISPR-associated endoribonuclease Cas6 [Bacteroidetes bacterium]|nr:CRISPR-associated endoribonuclease Cas6 [Bacteroidota bacterium]
MRFRLTLNNPTSATLIDWNHQYPLMSWLYKKLDDADPEYARFLHQEGYQSTENAKKFKFMTFSPFHFNSGKNEYKIDKEIGMIIYARNFYLDLSFYMPKAAESFILGVFRDQLLNIFNDRFRAEFPIIQISTLPEPEFRPEMIYKAVGPMNISLKREGKQDEYIRPDHPEFGKLLAINLSDKYFNATGHRVEPEAIKYELLTEATKIKSRKVAIKEYSRQETQIKGFYDFEFKLTTPIEVQKCGYYSGFGRYNVEGMGFCVIYKNPKI